MPRDIYPSMRYRDARAAIDWLQRAFAFQTHVAHENPDGTIAHAELRYGDGLVMLGSWRGDDDHRRPGQGWAYVAVDDLDAHLRQAREAGAEIVDGPQHEDYGSFYGARDPEGNLWSFGTYRPALECHGTCGRVHQPARRMTRRLPERLEGPDGLLLRRWVIADAEALAGAVTESAEHLRPWMAWIAEEPVALELRRKRIAEWERDWSQGGDVILGLFVDGRVAGGGGLHRRLGPDGLEIGYWIHPAFLRRGLATRVAGTLTDAAFTVPGITFVEIHHDKANQASGGVPRKLGFEWLGEAPDDPEAPAELGIEWRWRMDRDAWLARPPAAMAAGVTRDARR
ncbi:MAG: GNAT family N-acetyltransferase [Solirubrobacterales bacterium]|nr:GNAT family N-acetyltransferase [Solirubrobacterales bacterium]